MGLNNLPCIEGVADWIDHYVCTSQGSRAVRPTAVIADSDLFQVLTRSAGG